MLAHSTQEHTARQFEFHKKKSMALTTAAAAAVAYGQYNVADLLSLTSAAITNGYQRYLEIQAADCGTGVPAQAKIPTTAPGVMKEHDGRG